MEHIGGRWIYSASDLTSFLQCRHLSGRSRAVAIGEMQRPATRAGAELLQRKGEEHEIRFLNELKQRGFGVYEMPSRLREQTIEVLLAADDATRTAMAEGHEYIYQATFFDGIFQGRADFLQRIDDADSSRGFGYEVLDTKLARSAKAGFLVQLCAYNEHVARLQGDVMPRSMRVVLGSGEERRFNVGDYIAYYRHLRESFLTQIDSLQAYPYQCSHCAVCDWNDACESQRLRDDHLANVARMRRDQIEKLTGAGIHTGAELGNAAADTEVRGLNPRTFTILRTQARLQHEQNEAKASGKPANEWYRWMFREYDPRGGFALLPQPDDGDVYFDMEGDPYYAPDTGLEYLFGLYLAREDRYVDFWARSLADERKAASDLLSFLLERRQKYPNMHVYHYAPYEKTALGRLTTRYKVYEDALDDLLRAGVLVDLYAVVRQGIYVSQPSYSIKKLEPFYAFRRDAELKSGDDSILLFEQWLDERDDAILEKIRQYNDEDCRSTHRLHRWLLDLRAKLVVERGEEVPWFAPSAKTPSEERAKENAETLDLRNEILGAMAVPLDLAEVDRLSDADRLRWYVANIVDYHRSEAKPAWWEYFHRCANVDELVESDRKCIGDLTLRLDVEPYKLSQRDRNLVYTFSFPEQQHSLEADDDVHDADTQSSAGELVAIDETTLTLKLKRNPNLDHAALRALVPKPFSDDRMRKALMDIGRHYLAGTLRSQFPAVEDILLAATPRLRDRARGERIQPGTVDGAALAATIAALDRSYLVVQGPPGTGKSTKGGEAIVQLLADGKRIGVMARSHSAAHNLVAAVEDAARKRELQFSGAHKFAKERDRYPGGDRDDAYVTNVRDPAGALGAGYQLVSGTNFLFAADEAINAFDVLIVDEAGQLSIADAIACARAAPNVVFLGDPSQLAQVSEGKHPPGMDRSILEHLLGNTPTIRENRGVFLPISYRMHPSICDFISRLVYECRLEAANGNERNVVLYPNKLAESGLRWHPVEHDHNASSSDAEADAVVEEVGALLEAQCATRERQLGPLTTSDILIVSPYNAQRRLITRKLEERGITGVRVGTVDKFQGLQAPVVVYSMATSSGATMPRNLEFLFEKNRFNVAISRAQCLSILICCPRLLEIACRTPEQMALVNLLCAYTHAASTPRTRPSSPVPTG
jgi:predicted RecB family nuclease